MRTAGRAFIRLTAGTLLGVAVGVLALVLVPFAAGLRSMTVLSGSMEPTIGTGDVVVDEWIQPRTAQAGDVVTFNDPTRPGIALTHRIVSIRRRGNGIDFVTRGDANTGVERWSAPANGRIGRVVYRVPRVGFLMAFTRTGGGRFLFLVAPALLWGMYEVFRIWRPKKEEVVSAPAS